MISNYIPGIYPSELLPVGPGLPDGPIPGFQERFQALLADAQREYGARDASWNLLGLEVAAAGEMPAVRTSPIGGRNCVLRLSMDAAESADLLDWQLSHEVVHLLGPRPPAETTVFEEGVASYNQHRTRSAILGINAAFPDPRYQNAFDLVRPWLNASPPGVSRLRAATGGYLSSFSPDILRWAFPDMPNETALALAARFYS